MAKQLRTLVARARGNEIESVTPITGRKDDDGRWVHIDLRVIDTNGDEETYRVHRTSSLKQLAALGQAIDAYGIGYLTTPSLDIFQVLIDEDEADEYDDWYDEFDEEEAS